MILNIKFLNFLGGQTPEPTLRKGASPSQVHPPTRRQDDLRRFAPSAIQRLLRCRMLGPQLLTPVKGEGTGRSGGLGRRHLLGRGGGGRG
jgi:hypothetical protein